MSGYRTSERKPREPLLRWAREQARRSPEIAYPPYTHSPAYWLRAVRKGPRRLRRWTKAVRAMRELNGCVDEEA